jgi:hypothetical protein
MRNRKTAKKEIYLSVQMEHLGSQWTDFHDILYSSIFLTYVEKKIVYLISDKSNGDFTWTPVFIYVNITLNSF